MKFLILIAIVVVVIILIRNSRRGEESSVPPAVEKQPLANPDALVIEQLAAAGSNLTQPHDIDYYLYFPTEAKAQGAAKELVAEGYKVEVRASNDGDQILCLASMRSVPTVEAMGLARRKLTRVAETFGGEYDGWECAVVRS